MLIAAGFTVGALAFGPYFVCEHQRLSHWEGVIVWLGDGVALLWFIFYFTRHFVLGIPVRSTTTTPRRARVLVGAALLSMSASMGADLWVTLRLRESERESFARAWRTVGTIERLTKSSFAERVVYALDCSYLDVNQQAHSTTFIVRDPDEAPNLPLQLIQAIRAERLPISISIAYDPDRPQSSWLAARGWHDATRMYGFSFCVLLFQAMISVDFLLMLIAYRRSTGLFPWWYDLQGVLLVAVEASFMLLFGGLVLILGNRVVFWSGW